MGSGRRLCKMRLRAAGLRSVRAAACAELWAAGCRQRSVRYCGQRPARLCGAAQRVGQRGRWRQRRRCAAMRAAAGAETRAAGCCALGAALRCGWQPALCCRQRPPAKRQRKHIVIVRTARCPHVEGCTSAPCGNRGDITIGAVFRRSVRQRASCWLRVDWKV